MDDIAELISDLRDVLTKNVAASKLARAGAEALPAVLTVLNDTSEADDVRAHAAWIVGKMGGPGLSAADDLAAAAADRDNPREMRKMALYSLGTMSVGAVGALPTLRALLDEEPSYGALHFNIENTIKKIGGGVL